MIGKVLSISFVLLTLWGAGGLQAENRAAPQELRVSIGGFLGPSYTVALQNGALIYTAAKAGPLPPDKTLTFHPGAEEWTQFRAAVDKAGAWGWKAQYFDPQIMDGTQWSVQLRWDGKALSSSGSNAYPPEAEFKAFFDGLRVLVKGAELR